MIKAAAGPETGPIVRYAGVALVAASIGTVAVMSHHPTGAHSGALGPAVHGAMILFLGFMAFGFVGMMLWRGASRPLMVAGVLAYAISLLGHLVAGTINGFVVPAIAARGVGAVSHDIFVLAWETNQAFAKLGVLATSAAYVLWSIGFLMDGDRRLKISGLLGLIAGIAPAAMLLGGSIQMNVAGAFLSYAIQAAWAALVGVAMIRAAKSDL